MVTVVVMVMMVVMVDEDFRTDLAGGGDDKTRLWSVRCELVRKQ